MSILKIFILFFLFLSIYSCNQSDNSTTETTGKDKFSGTISISGAFALYPLAVKWSEEFQKLHPDVRIDISAGGAGKGITDALSGMVDLGMVSREISKEETDKGAWKIAVAKDAVLPTVNNKNPIINQLKEKGFTKDEFINIFINGEITKWRDNSKMNIYTRSDACGAAEMWGKFLDKNQESLLGIGVFGDPGIADAIKNDISGIGYNNIGYIYDITSGLPYEGITVLPVDINANGKIDSEENFYSSLKEILTAIKNNNYPSPPSRDLYFVSNGKPANIIVIEFLNWILTDGQKYVDASGYVQFTEEKIKSELEKLK
ncbi:MAG: substrate-binding domain-containing protein [Bacteroidota bacterium]